MNLRVAFAGTPAFASAALQALLEADFAVPLVLTQPDRPAGRGMKRQASPVKQLALAHGLPLAQPRSLRLDGRYPEDAQAARVALQAADADVLVVAAYGLILPRWALELPRLGALNIHASLLPRWRGAAPIQRAIEAGDAETGVTIMQMDEGLDTGDMLLAARLPIAADATSASLHDQLATLGARLIVEALHLARQDGLEPVPQPQQGVSYAHKIEKAEAVVDWRQPAELIERRVRAFDPFPGASTALGPAVIKLWGARVEPDDIGLPPAPAGTVLAIDEGGVRVACGAGVLRLTELQRAGGKRLRARDFLAGFAVAPGDRLGPVTEAAP